MKRNISDLLDRYPAEDVELGGNTPYSPTRIKEITMKKIHTETKSGKRSFRPARLLVAAAVAAAFTVSALAAGRLLGGELFGDVFSQGDGSLTPGQMETIDRLVQTFEGQDGAAPAAVTHNGASITPLAALADENVYYLRLRVEAPEGTLLPDLDPDTDGYYQLFGNQPEEALSFTSESGENIQGIAVSCEWQPDSDPADNVKEVVIRFTAQGTQPAVYNNQEGKTLTIQGLWIQAPNKAYTPVFTGIFALDVGGAFERRSLSVDCGGADYVDITGLGYTTWLDRVVLSPLSISVWFRDNVKPDQTSRVHFGGSQGFCEGLQLVLKDGTVAFDNVPTWTYNPADLNWDASTMLADGPISDKNGYAPFDRPLDLDQVDYIKFGEHIIPVNAD